MLNVYNKTKSIKQIRNCFPSLAYTDLVYLDTAASSQTVDSAIKAVSDYHYNYRANVHRGDFDTSSTASDIYEQTRKSIAELIEADEVEIAFTSGTTHGLNIIAEHFANDPRPVIITELEHHSNIMPWLKTGRKQKDGTLIVVPASDNGDVSIEDFTDIVKQNPNSIVSFLTQSNFTGMCLPWQQMVRIAKEHDCEVILDVCQTIGHKPVSVSQNNIDWLVFSSHKMYGSTGTGVLFHRGGFSSITTSYVGGGTLSFTDFDHYELQPDFRRVEAGTPNVAGVHSIGAAAKWIQEIGYKDIQECEAEFFNMLFDKGLFDIKHMKVIGPVEPRSVYSFILPGINPSDIAGLLNFDKVCVRTGHLCATPASRRYNQEGTGVLRVSSGPYNDEHDCVKLVEGLWTALEKMGYKIS